MIEKISKVFVFIIVVSMLMSGCGSTNNSADVELYETVSDQPDVFYEKISLNNCGGKADVSQVAERSREITIEGTAELGAQAQVVEAKIAAKYSEGHQAKKSITLTAPPSTNMEFLIVWTDRSWTGTIVTSGVSNQPTYKVRVPISVSLESANDLGCGNNSSEQPSSQPQSNPTSVPQPPSSTISFSPLCKGTVTLVFHDGLPETDPCNGEVASSIVSGVWVVVEPRTNAGWQTGKCLFHYSVDSPEGIYEGSMWALFRTNASDNTLPTCPTTK